MRVYIMSHCLYCWYIFELYKYLCIYVHISISLITPLELLNKNVYVCMCFKIVCIHTYTWVCIELFIQLFSVEQFSSASFVASSSLNAVAAALLTMLGSI